MFVPGLGTDGSVYAPFLDAFRSGYDVQPADPPVRFPEKLSWGFFFGPIDRAVGDGPAILVGHSLGGAIALKYAASHPGRVDRVIAVAPVLFPFKRIRRAVIENIHNFRISLTGGHPLRLLRIGRTIRERAGQGRARKLYDFAGAVDLARDLPKLRNATVLFPEREEVVPRGQFDRVRREFRNVRTKAVPGSHHHIALAPRRVIKAVREELDG